ncbi:YoaK family protein [uncultured Limosilactobacillus sp.]|uniref:YoaK family protein n=1 Tax=uncultured Limosilactobacillus sp. TaxID=2837629 RepID=UPI002601598A|nr:YoaK family protein [uncultured Limosilactobacillus sp.]
MNWKPAEARSLAVALTFSGGFVDAYTYIQRGHTLSAGQTGNVIFLASAMADHNFLGMLNRLSTFLAFSLGLAVVGFLHARLKTQYWRVICLFPILLICGVVGFLPRSIPNYYIVPTIAFGLAMQNGSFSKIQGMGYNNTFTTGNLKKSVVAWSAYFFGADDQQYTAAVNYLLLVLAFAGGAICSAMLQHLMGIRTIWLAIILLGIVNLNYVVKLRRQTLLG